MFLVPIVAVIIIMEVLLRAIPNDYMTKNKYLTENANQIETLILGSSHSYYGLNPFYFSSRTYNSSFVSQSLRFDFEILQKFESSYENLKTVVVPVSYFSIYSQLENGAEAWRLKNYNLYFDINTRSSWAYYSEFTSNKLVVNLKLLYSYYFLKNSQLTSTELGWGNSYRSLDAKDLIDSGLKAAKRHTVEDQDKVSLALSDNIAVLNKMIEWCENRNVTLLFYTPPAFKSYRESLNKKQLTNTIEAIAKISYGHKNCNYINMLSDTSFKSSDFYDADHLSEIGAKKLSLFMNKQVEKFTVK